MNIEKKLVFGPLGSHWADSERSAALRDELTSLGQLLLAIPGNTTFFDVGKLIDRVVDLATRLDDDEALTFQNVQTLCRLGYNDDSIANEFTTVTRRGVPGLPTVGISRTPAGTRINNIDTLPGILAVLGGTSAGKSRYVADTIRPSITIRVGEPNEEYDRLPTSYSAASIVEALAAAMVFGLLGHIVAIDSLKKLASDIDGPAKSEGVIATMYSVLTDINNVYANLGLVVVVTINPLLSDAGENAMYNGLAGSVTSAVHIRKQQVVASGYRTADGRIIGWDDNVTDPEVDRAGPPLPTDVRAHGTDVSEALRGVELAEDPIERPRDLEAIEAELIETARQGASFTDL